jgi:hypothetical protein
LPAPPETTEPPDLELRIGKGRDLFLLVLHLLGKRGWSMEMQTTEKEI